MRSTLRVAFLLLLTAQLAGCGIYQQHRQEQARHEYLEQNPDLDPGIAEGVREGVPVTGMTIEQATIAADWGIVPARHTSDGLRVYTWRKEYTEFIVYFRDGVLEYWESWVPPIH